MLDFNFLRDPITNAPYVETSLSGKPLLTIPQLNKSTAFTNEERELFGLLGKLPNRVETLEEQVNRAYLQYLSYTTRLQQNIYLNNLHDKNQILFYKLVSCYLTEMLPTIYTPIVGAAVKRFSHEYRQPRGLYISHFDEDKLEEIICNRSNPEIDLMVVTDGEGVLGIGDQGIGGMDIPVAKLMVYSLCGGIDPTRTLPVFLDVGTNNQDLLNDPFYLGCRHPRIDTDHYDRFIDKFVKTVTRHFPQAFLHWEDFGRSNARRILTKYQSTHCTFNDDIQGTGAVTVAALLAACDAIALPLEEQRIVVFGAGSAGTGICDQILDALMRKGLSAQQAYARFWLIDRQGLLIKQDPHLTESQLPYAREAAHTLTLLETVQSVKPSILIGCSGQAGAFSKEVVQAMAEHCERPIIFPLSNPDEHCEAHPQDILTWTQGKALIATGTAFPGITQCNNALVFPGIGLGILAVKAKRLTATMLWAAIEALSQSTGKNNAGTPLLLPSLDNAQSTAKMIAIAVAKAAIDEEIAEINQDKDLIALINDLFWEPRYLPFRKK